ncbi:hypothetical protein PHYBOEH_004186 [Phytophthora boehmeriae]|uniref:Uncharacterized protein n=1 Tax=Phytophthora boehmeriae TaxID=109152 RepID=A0A8T1WPP2_9STRA|nr:hypothetical protein PHYBOEH_004186 [Phytophthora boehmeriae]
MVGSDEVAAGASLSAHFEAKRRILATVKQMEERGEKLQEATPDEVLEAASKAAQTVFRFDFSLDDEQDAATAEPSARKRSRNRKKHKKRRGKKTDDNSEEQATNSAVATVSQRSNGSDNVKPQRVEDAAQSKPKASKSVASSSFLKLRKATGTESEVAKMQLRYGQGRRNLAATKQREQRKKAGEAATTNSDFKFNFATA